MGFGNKQVERLECLQWPVWGGSLVVMEVKKDRDRKAAVSRTEEVGWQLRDDNG